MKKLKHISLFFLSGLMIGACQKEPDSPPENILPEGNIITIDSLRGWQESVSPGSVTITDPLHVYGIVTMDESDGNIYKNLYVQDHTDAINMRLTTSSDFRVGDSVRIALQGAVLSEYSGVIQLDSIDPDLDIILQSSGNEIAPVTKTIPEISLDDEAMLIRLNNVQFINSELGNTYADAANQASENRMLEDCSGNMIILRTSGFADFADQTIAENNGSIVCIVNRFNDELQLIIRDFDEVNMNGPRCAGQILTKDFDDESINSGGWSTSVVVGTHNWSTADVGSSTHYALISNYTDPDNFASETWLISPTLDLSSGMGSMSFDNAYNYFGDPLKLMVSTDFPGSGDPNLSTWTDISSEVTWSSGGWEWINSGNVDLSAFVGSSVYVAFKYTGSTTSGSTWEIDNIVING